VLNLEKTGELGEKIGVKTFVITSIFSRIVAPSLVTVTSPSGLTSILSMPFGPSDVLMMFVMERAARIFALCASKPCLRCWRCCSRRICDREDQYDTGAES
jgi:hypothetical protein